MLSHRYKSAKRLSSISLAAFASLGASSVLANTQTSTWVGPANAGWDTAADWSPVGVPDNGTNGFTDYNVIIGTPASTVLNVNNETIDDLTINSGGDLVLNPTFTFNVNGPTLTDNGLIQVDNPSSGSPATLNFGANTFLTGTGTVELDDANPNAAITGGAGVTLTQDTGSTIDGVGEIDTALVNNGTVNANYAPGGYYILLHDSNMTNNNIFESSLKNTLNIDGITVTQGSGGQIISGTNSAVTINSGATISGGTISGPGSVTTSTATFIGVNISAGTTVAVTPATTLSVSGPTFMNNGIVLIDNSSSGSPATLNFATNTSLTGTGTLELDDFNPNALITGGTGVTLTQGANSTIDGVGEIDAAFVNNGIVNANYAPGANAIVLRVNNMTNNNIFESSLKNTLNIDGITVTQGSGGQIISGTNSAVTINTGATIDGGTISGPGSVTTSTATFNGVMIPTGTTVVVAAATTLNVGGPTFTNNGVVQVDTLNSNAVLNFTATTELNGSGTIKLDDYNPNAAITGAAGVTLTQDAGNLIDGVGAIDVALVNSGTVNADFGSGHSIFLQTSNMTNNALFEATGADTLDIGGITVTQGAAGQIIASGTSSALLIHSGATIVGGTISGPGAVTVSNSTFNGVTIAAGTNVLLPAATILNVVGPKFTNNGLIQIDALTSNAALNFTTSTELSGLGTIKLDDYNPNAAITGAAGVTLTQDAGGTIHGVGAIDVPLVNNGIVNSDFGGGHVIFINSPITGSGSLIVSAVSQIKLAIGTGLNQQGSLSVASTGILDITNNALAINYGVGNPSPISTIKSEIISGYNGGAWTGDGIDSSSAAANHSYAVGYADGSVDTQSTAAPGQVLIKYALIGDTNLDNTVNLTDLLSLLNSYGQTGKDWAQGDTNYDGSVNLTDLLALLNNYGDVSNGAQATLQSSQVVPEPASLGLLAAGAGGLLTRRVRRSRTSQAC